MIEPTHSLEMRLRSVKKFIVDTFAASYPVYFDVVETAPVVSGTPVNSWMCVIEAGSSMDSVSYADFQIILFAKGDKDGDVIAVMHDTIVSELVDLTQTDCRKRIEIYDSEWEKAFTAVLVLKDSLQTVRLETGIKAKVLPFSLYWGAK